jgi:hypothetical protein
VHSFGASFLLSLLACLVLLLFVLVVFFSSPSFPFYHRLDYIFFPFLFLVVFTFCSLLEDWTTIIIRAAAAAVALCTKDCEFREIAERTRVKPRLL